MHAMPSQQQQHQAHPQMHSVSQPHRSPPPPGPVVRASDSGASLSTIVQITKACKELTAPANYALWKRSVMLVLHEYGALSPRDECICIQRLIHHDLQQQVQHDSAYQSGTDCDALIRCLDQAFGPQLDRLQVAVSVVPNMKAFFKKVCRA